LASFGRVSVDLVLDELTAMCTCSPDGIVLNTHARVSILNNLLTKLVRAVADLVQVLLNVPFDEDCGCVLCTELL